MTAERWREVEAILQEALDQPQAARRGLLDARCAHDPELRREVESLLGFDGAGESAIADVIEDAEKLLTETQRGVAPQRIGEYRVLREIGRGGMGTVYLAQRETELSKPVAVKVVTRGMDTSALLGRFRLERRILARLEHPFIVRLLDGGSTERGRPYLVMDYVDGVTITTYCRQKALDSRARIELFRQVCTAVQYAHQSLIIHRDLKPSNILVDTHGSPKLLDFGMAKLMEPSAGFQTMTMPGLGPMFTPDYASPEQVRGEELTTATDIYSLGAILYELLTSVRPHHIETYSPSEIERAICQEEPPLPSKVAAGRIKHDDLDNILLKALSKDPRRRYSSAAEFADDLGRYLAGEPVRAREDTLAYRASRFIKRNKGGVLAASLLVASLAGGITATTIQARRAERRFRDVQRLARAVIYDIHDAVRDLPGSTKARETIVRTALDYLEDLGREAGSDPRLLTGISAAYLRVGNVQGDLAGGSLGKTQEALLSIGKGIAAAEILAGQGGESPPAAINRILLYQAQGDLLTFSGNKPAGAESYRKAIAAGDDLLRRFPSNRDSLLTLAKVYRSIDRDVEDSAQALANAKKAVSINERLVEIDPRDKIAEWELAQSYGPLGIALRARQQIPESVTLLRRSVEIRERITSGEPFNARRRGQLSNAYFTLGDALGNPSMPNAGDRAGALQAYRKSLAIDAEQMREDPNDAPAAMGYALTLTRLANVTPQQNAAQALNLLHESRTILERLRNSDSKNARLRQHLTYTILVTGRWQALMGNTQVARKTFLEVLEMTGTLNPDSVSRRHSLEAHSALAPLLAASGDRTAITHALQSIALAEELGRRDPSNPAMLARTPQANALMGDVYTALSVKTKTNEDRQQAREFFNRSVGAWAAVEAVAPLLAEQSAERERVRRLSVKL